MPWLQFWLVASNYCPIPPSCLLQVRERKEKQVMEELNMMVPSLKPLVDPATGAEMKRTVELWLPEKKIRAWNARCVPRAVNQDLKTCRRGQEL